MIYALTGEPLLVRKALARLMDERLPSGRGFNLETLEGERLRASQLLQSAMTLPTLSARRLIIVRNADQVQKTEMEKIQDELDRWPETCDLILVAEKTDLRLGFWKKVEKIGKVQSFKDMSRPQTVSWVLQECSAAGHPMAPDAAQWLVDAIGTDLLFLHSTLEKLFLLVGEKKGISIGDLETCVLPFSWKTVFDLTDAVGRKSLPTALSLFRKMSVSGESPIGLLAILARHFRILSRVQEGSFEEIPPFFLKEYQRQAKDIAKRILTKIREKIFHADWALKSSPLPSSIIFEKLLRDICHPPS